MLPGVRPVTLGEGFTPLLPAERLGREIGLRRLLIKDESVNPTGSFKGRGISGAVSVGPAPGGKGAAASSARNARSGPAAHCGGARNPAGPFPSGTTAR